MFGLGSSRSTAPAATTTTNQSSSPVSPSAPAKMPSTPPAASTSTTPPPGRTLDELTGETTKSGAISGEDQVHAICDEPETKDQAPEDDHLVGVRVDPGPEPGQEGLVGLETGVDLDGQVGGRAEDA